MHNTRSVFGKSIVIPTEYCPNTYRPNREPLMRVNFSTLLKALPVTLCLLATACGHSPATPEEPVAMPKIRTVALLRVEEPVNLTLFNRPSGTALLTGLIPAVGVVASIAREQALTQNSVELSNRMREMNVRFGEDMTAALQDELQRAGYEVKVIENDNAKYNPDEETDLTKVQADTDAYLYVRLAKLGFYSPFSKINYVIQLNTSAELLLSRDHSPLFDTYIYYGVDANKNAPDMIRGDPKYEYDGFSSLMQHSAEAAEGIREGIRKSAVRIVRQMNDKGLLATTP